MLLYSLSIDVKEKLHKITSSDFRKFILALTDRFPNEIKSKINFHITDEAFRTKNQRKIPYILFSKPFENSFQNLCLWRYRGRDFRKNQRDIS